MKIYFYNKEHVKEHTNNQLPQPNFWMLLLETTEEADAPMNTATKLAIVLFLWLRGSSMLVEVLQLLLQSCIKSHSGSYVVAVVFITYYECISARCSKCWWTEVQYNTRYFKIISHSNCLYIFLLHISCTQGSNWLWVYI